MNSFLFKICIIITLNYDISIPIKSIYRTIRNLTRNLRKVFYCIISINKYTVVKKGCTRNKIYNVDE